MLDTLTSGPAPINEDAGMFELAPVSLWLEDFSGVRALFDEWRAAGVTDLRAHFADDPHRVAECAHRIGVVKVNRQTLTQFEASDFDTLTSNLASVFRDDMLKTHLEELCQLWAGQLHFTSHTVNYTLGGRRLDVLLKGAVLPGHEERWDRVLVSTEDITELEGARRRVALAEQYARGLFEHSPVSLWVEDFSTVKRLLDGARAAGINDFRVFTDVHPEFVERCMAEIHVLDVNQHTLEMFAAKDKKTLLARLSEVFRDDMRPHFREQLIDLWDNKLFQQREVLNYSLDGNEVHVHLQFSVLPGHEQNWDLVLVALTDITARKKAEAYLEFLGKHDVLTKLRNRSFYVDELNRLERKGPWPVTIIIADLNGLKRVNDQLGHAAGDALLRRAGEVLAKAMEPPFHAARIGGDEFAILMPDTDERSGAAMIDAIRQLVEMNNQFYPGAPLHFSMGAATCQRGDRLESGVQRADLRMYEEKRAHYENQPAPNGAGK
ncbi:sensor domain-containing diguanylate cyclase [Paraburkholderia susongensis]|uniref:Diguanylate cyclase (GGDEF) domain-containing protein n=1 Tax=Paraburkholderia susongensis TaxID=1515439 RepID=A0A1X7LZ05_9BURK|nr:sensor domain-containing diguanylate cyclase [Paraburkholderia susongensis]SMG59138.1 diguanylate cyclase (GGDEF) domain-containing protein [Paraburkholderia susongensis]